MPLTWWTQKNLIIVKVLILKLIAVSLFLFFLLEAHQPRKVHLLIVYSSTVCLIMKNIYKSLLTHLIIILLLAFYVTNCLQSSWCRPKYGLQPFPYWGQPKLLEFCRHHLDRPLLPHRLEQLLRVEELQILCRMGKSGKSNLRHIYISIRCSKAYICVR